MIYEEKINPNLLKQARKIADKDKGLIRDKESLEIILLRIEGFRGGLPLNQEQKFHYLIEAFNKIKEFKKETPEFFHFEYDLMNLVDSLKARKTEVKGLLSSITIGDIIFCYLIGSIEDRNRLINDNFYPATGHDFYWGLIHGGLTYKERGLGNVENSLEIIEKYNSYMGIPERQCKPIRLPTDLLHGYSFNTSPFQYFRDDY